MLLSFRVANHRSLIDEQELSLVATEFTEHAARPTDARFEGKPVSVFPVVGLSSPTNSTPASTHCWPPRSSASSRIRRPTRTSPSWSSPPATPLSSALPWPNALSTATRYGSR